MKCSNRLFTRIYRHNPTSFGHTHHHHPKSLISSIRRDEYLRSFFMCLGIIYGIYVYLEMYISMFFNYLALIVKASMDFFVDFSP